jgi:hypothetical protein
MLTAGFFRMASLECGCRETSFGGICIHYQSTFLASRCAWFIRGNAENFLCFYDSNYGWKTLDNTYYCITSDPCIGIGYAVQNPNTPYLLFLILALLCGLGGGNFASSMAKLVSFSPK